MWKKSNYELLDSLSYKAHDKKFIEIIDYHNKIWYITSKKTFSLDELLHYYVIVWVSYQELWDLESANIFFDRFLENIEVTKEYIKEINNKNGGNLDEYNIKFMFLMNKISELWFNYKVPEKHKKKGFSSLKIFLFKYDFLNLISIVSIFLLIIAFFNNPYVYYQIMKVIISLWALYSFFKVYSDEEMKFLWKEKINFFAIFFIVMWLVYPIFHLWRDAWEVVNIIAIAWYAYFLYLLNTKR